MRIGQINWGNYNEISRLFTRVSKKKPSTSSSQSLTSKLSNTKDNYTNTIDDLLSGHLKNSYGVEGMVISGKSNWKRTINVSKEMKQNVFEDVKKEFYQYGGMSGNNISEHDAYYKKIHNYVKTLDTKDRSAATWTLSQLHLEFADKVTKAVKEQDPSWTAGKPIPSQILDGIFSDTAIFQDCMGTSSLNKSIDTTI